MWTHLLIVGIIGFLTKSVDATEVSATYPAHWRELIAAPAAENLNFTVLLQYVCTMEMPNPSEEPNTKRRKQRENWEKQVNEAAHRLNDLSLRDLSSRIDVIGDEYFMNECSNANFVRKQRKDNTLYFGKTSSKTLSFLSPTSYIYSCTLCIPIQNFFSAS